MRTRSVVPFILICVLAAACTSAAPFLGLLPGNSAGTGGAAVVISSPTPGASLPAGAPVAVVATATDVTGVARVDLAADGVVVDSFTSPQPTGQPTLSVELHWTPSQPGAHTLVVTAYEADGTAAQPASVAVTVFGEAGPSEASASPIASPTAEPTPTQKPTPRPTAAPTPKPADIDLRLATVQVVGVTQPDGSTSLDVQMQIKNEGTDPSGTFQVSATCQGTTKFATVHGIAPGTYRAADVTFAPTDTGTDPRTPKAVVDPGRHIRETNELNNALTIDDPLCAAKPPDIDLRLATVQLVGITNPDGSAALDVSMLIKNEGTDPSGAFQVSVTCQGTTKLRKVRSIPGGTYKAVDVDFAPTDTGTDPNANVKVDPNNQVKEIDETNNDFTITDPQCAPAP